MMNTSKIPVKRLIKLRREIHKNPELAGEEKLTAKRIISFAKNYNPDKIIPNIGGKGLAVIFEGMENGPTVLIRCELDALPISETNKLNYRSIYDNVAHKCGHDGHMTIVSGLIPLLSKNKLKKGRVVLLYQPSEETGEGAEKILNDKKFRYIKPDFVFALHNLPGFGTGRIVIKEREFAAASKGMIIKLIGKTSHAAEPEKGINPALAVSEIIAELTSLPKKIRSIKDFSLITIIHSKIGERAFGTSPGYAEVMATLRSYKNTDMKLVKENTLKKVKTIAHKYKLKTEFNFLEDFPATINEKGCVDIVINAAKENKLKTKYLNEPFKWSEDFGHFTKKFKGTLFGLGAGIKHPALHNPDYDFPDEIIVPGVKTFYSIINLILN
jgi:amidohydrolase